MRYERNSIPALSVLWIRLVNNKETRIHIDRLPGLGYSFLIFSFILTGPASIQQSIFFFLLDSLLFRPLSCSLRSRRNNESRKKNPESFVEECRRRAGKDMKREDRTGPSYSPFGTSLGISLASLAIRIQIMRCRREEVPVGRVSMELGRRSARAETRHS